MLELSKPPGKTDLLLYAAVCTVIKGTIVSRQQVSRLLAALLNTCPLRCQRSPICYGFIPCSPLAATAYLYVLVGAVTVSKRTEQSDRKLLFSLYLAIPFRSWLPNREAPSCDTWDVSTHRCNDRRHERRAFNNGSNAVISLCLSVHFVFREVRCCNNRRLTVYNSSIRQTICTPIKPIWFIIIHISSINSSSTINSSNNSSSNFNCNNNTNPATIPRFCPWTCTSLRDIRSTPRLTAPAAGKIYRDYIRFSLSRRSLHLRTEREARIGLRDCTLRSLTRAHARHDRDGSDRVKSTSSIRNLKPCIDT